MKKITLLTAILATFTGFSQVNKQKIQSYLNQNLAKMRMTTQDIADWVIESEVQGSGTGITSTYIVQRYQGIEIFNAQNNVWVKNGSVLNMPDNNFKSSIASKVNSVTPSLNVLEAITTVYREIGNTKKVNFSIAETLSDKCFKLSDGLSDDVISAKLVYQNTNDDKLKLAWAFQFYAPTNGNLLDLRIDAITGKILEQNNLTISCNFGNHDHLNTKKEPTFNFEKLAFKTETKSLVAAPGVAGQYRVIPYNYTSPNHSPFQLITTSGNVLASPNGWHNTNDQSDANAALRWTYTRGNNVWAKIDAAGDNGTTIYPDIDGTASLTFDFPYVNQNQQPNEYSARSTTNLFYMNNIMHDVWYQYGFTESAGNFQKNNLGRGVGAGVSNSAVGDFVRADAQDGYLKTTQDLNNANFSTPNDGSSPRMQMFMWNSNAPPLNLITINAPSSIAGVMEGKDNNFEGTDRNPLPASPGITKNVALFSNEKKLPTYSGNSGCSQVVLNAQELANKIVLIRRGGCFFKDKVKKAQDLGAAAVIMMDSVVTQPDSNLPNFYPGPIFMGSSGLNGITIPAISITKENGDALVAALLNGSMEIKLENPANQYRYADGSFDNTIIAHEYGHGISNKLIGGPANSSCMTNLEQMGEGWSDWFGLMMQLKAGDNGADRKSVGTFAINQPNNGSGIRDFPYSTNLVVNPRTFAGTNTPLPTTPADTGYRYVMGEFWASVLWDLNWAYITKYGYDANIYSGTGGNNKVMKLVIDALKLQACNTATLISGRDNIFAAELATTNGLDYDMIAAVFARRGLGLNASSGDANITNDQSESFTPFPAFALSNQITNFLNSAVRIYPNPANSSLNIRVGGLEGKINMQIVDLNGRLIFDRNDDKFNLEKTLDISNLQSGIYLLNLKANNLNYTQKLIKN